MLFLVFGSRRGVYREPSKPDATKLSTTELVAFVNRRRRRGCVCIGICSYFKRINHKPEIYCTFLLSSRFFFILLLTLSYRSYINRGRKEGVVFYDKHERSSTRFSCSWNKNFYIFSVSFLDYEPYALILNHDFIIDYHRTW